MLVARCMRGPFKLKQDAGAQASQNGKTTDQPIHPVETSSKSRESDGPMFHVRWRNRNSNSFPLTEQKLGSEHFRQTFSRWALHVHYVRRRAGPRRTDEMPQRFPQRMPSEHTKNDSRARPDKPREISSYPNQIPHTIQTGKIRKRSVKYRVTLHVGELLRRENAELD